MFDINSSFAPPQTLDAGETFFVVLSENGSNGSPQLQVNNVTVTGTAVPEPSTLLLGLAAAVGFVVRRRR